MEKPLKPKSTPAENMAKFAEVQRKMWAEIMATPESYQAYLERNYKKRRVSADDTQH